MPDSFEHTPVLAMRMPNGALASLAGNVDRHHQVAIADLVLVQQAVVRTVERLMHEIRPDLVGLSVMTFQRRTALKLIRLMRHIKPDVQIVAGGYDPSLAPDAYEAPSAGVDFVVRGEGDLTFRDLLRHLERESTVDDVTSHTRPVHQARRRFRPRPAASCQSLGGWLNRAASSRRARLVGLHVSRPTHRYRGNVARLYPTTAVSVRSSKCAAATFTR